MSHSELPELMDDNLSKVTPEALDKCFQHAEWACISSGGPMGPYHRWIASNGDWVVIPLLGCNDYAAHVRRAIYLQVTHELVLADAMRAMLAKLFADGKDHAVQP